MATRTQTRQQAKKKRLILVGNPNVGKSVIFSLLTGQYVTVSNYPGTTIEVSTGKAKGFDRPYEVVDTPGVLSFLAASEDELVTQKVISDSEEPVVIQVADAKNLRRNLLLTLPLIEMGHPIHLNLNMIDEARSKGVKIDAQKLAEILGINVTETVAIRGKGIDRLRRSIATPRQGTYCIDYGPELEQSIRKIASLLSPNGSSARAQAITILAGDERATNGVFTHLDPTAREMIRREVAECTRRIKKAPSTEINQRRVEAADKISRQVVSAKDAEYSRFRGWLGHISTHPVWGVPILLAVLFIVYEFVGVFGAGTAVDFLESTVFGHYINPFFIWVASFIPSQFVTDLLVGEYGVITMAVTYSVAIVFPVVGAFFIIFGILEDSGYLPRLAFMVDRIFRYIGLNGKAVLPMILGLGCDTMATLTARILETKKERVLVTLLLALGIPCSAQLGVILGMLSGLSLFATVIWGGSVIAVLFVVGLLYTHLFPGKRSDFILEVPPLRWPRLSNIFVKTFARIEWYLKEAVPLFILGTLLLFLLDYFNLLAYLEKAAAPLVTNFLGLPKEVTGAFLIGFLRRDYGAAGLFVLARNGVLDPIQIVVSLVTITLFVPCIANSFIIIKERGFKTAFWMSAFIFPFAFLVGGTLNWILHALEVVL
jgi:ferrous iron transport protein B